MWRAIYGSIGLAALLTCIRPAVGEPPRPDPAQVEFFEAKVRPILVTRCLACHGADKQKGGLRLDSPEAMNSGGDTGPVVVAHDPEHSPLIAALRHDGDVRMPPKGKLDPAEIDALTEWVNRGAPWPASSAAAPSPGKAAAEPPFWAFQPMTDPTPPVVKQADWPKSTIDAFILAKLEENGLQPSPPADKPTLLRRVSFDLIGLPPTPEEVEAFVNDTSPDAYKRVVDRLLASPRYGERWGRHWLDVARYGEDQAHSFQPRLYPNGFRYRDWVASALNADMPYDRFIVEQIAGDLLDEPGKTERLAALGFFALGPVYYGDPKKFDQVDDRIDTMARGFLGLTVACARCHDHKFDPIPTADYYALAGVFLSTEYEEAPAAPKEQVAAYDAAMAAVDAKARAIDAVLESESARIHAPESVAYLVAALSLQADRTMDRDAMQDVAKNGGLDSARLRRWVALLEKSKDHPQIKESFRVARAVGGIADDESRRVVLHAAEGLERHIESVLSRRSYGARIDGADETLLRALFDGKARGPLAEGKDKVEKQLAPGDKARLAALRAEKARLEKAAPPKYPVVHTLKDAEQSVDANILVRGDVANPGPKAPRHFLTVLGGGATFGQGSGRLELARAIADAENPLTVRVMVNRIWQHHFGRGLVGTPSNFGMLGERPSHPALLDHLARRFVAGGWSIKSLHRDILLSAAYQQDSRASARSAEVDPENRLLGRMNRSRLEIEAWRDAVLAVSGRLDDAVGGPSERIDAPENRRRTYYAAVSRHDLAPMLRLFDFPDPNITGAARVRTTVPLQGLVMLNDEFLIESARALAARVRTESKDDDGRIRRAYALLFGRPATERELRIGRDYLAGAEPGETPPGDLSRWERYAQALLGTNEFAFID